MAQTGTEIVRHFIEALESKENFRVVAKPGISKQVFQVSKDTSTLLYIKGIGHHPYKWGVTKNVILRLQKQSENWAVVLIYDSIDTGYLITPDDTDYYSQKVWPLAGDGDYKPAMGAYLSRNQPFATFKEFLTQLDLINSNNVTDSPSDDRNLIPKGSLATEYGNIHGSKKYEIRARQILPILVRQAKAAKSITYSNLAHEVGMPNPRNLDYPLGTIGGVLMKLGDLWGQKIPPLQAMVINKNDGLPGKGISDFVADPKKYLKSSKSVKKKIVGLMLIDIFQYQAWDKVLAELSLNPPAMPIPPSVDHPEIIRKKYGSGGEREEHRQLKKYIALHPEAVGIPSKYGPGDVEYTFPSGDSVDVRFVVNDEWVGIEVKPSTSGIEDLTRGMYQCVKYTALLRAVQRVSQLPPSSRTILAIGGVLPESLISTKNILGVEIIENIQIR